MTVINIDDLQVWWYGTMFSIQSDNQDRTDFTKPYVEETWYHYYIVFDRNGGLSSGNVLEVYQDEELIGSTEISPSSDCKNTSVDIHLRSSTSYYYSYNFV